MYLKSFSLVLLTVWITGRTFPGLLIINAEEEETTTTTEAGTTTEASETTPPEPDPEPQPEVTESSKDSAKKQSELIIVNRTEVEKKCSKVGKCWASDKLLPICAGDKLVYQNPGVFMCSTRCNATFELEHFCYLQEMDTEEDMKKMCVNCAVAIQKMRDEALAAAANAPTE